MRCRASILPASLQGCMRRASACALPALHPKSRTLKLPGVGSSDGSHPHQLADGPRGLSVGAGVLGRASVGGLRDSGSYCLSSLSLGFRLEGRGFRV